MRTMKKMLWCGLVSAVVTISATAGAQEKMSGTDRMSAMKSDATYTGCVERTPDGAFTLTHANGSGAMSRKDMSKDSMAADSKAHDSMMKDAMASSFALSSTSVKLAKYVGHKVTVNGVEGDGMGGMTTLAIKSIKQLARSCS
jgi:hypothetical protein